MIVSVERTPDWIEQRHCSAVQRQAWRDGFIAGVLALGVALVGYWRAG